MQYPLHYLINGRFLEHIRFLMSTTRNLTRSNCGELRIPIVHSEPLKNPLIRNHCVCYILVHWGGVNHTLFENKVELNPGLCGVKDVASSIISHKQSLMFSIFGSDYFPHENQ